MIELTAYGSAVLLADMEFRDKDYVPSWKSHNFIRKGTKTYVEKNPNYPYKTREEERLARYKHENKRREFIIQYLKDKYSNKDYDERYEHENKWNLPLKYHNEETLQCTYLHEDKHHCNKKRKSTTCYTCCFDCKLIDCISGECEFIKKEERGGIDYERTN